MKTVLINGTEYKIEYSFEAAYDTDFVSECFKMMSGAYIVGNIIQGAADMMAVLPKLCTIGFKSGLLEHNPVDEAEAKNLMKTYMKDHKLGFTELWDELKTQMEEDGFLDLTGIQQMLDKMVKSVENETEKVPKKNKKNLTTVK